MHAYFPSLSIHRDHVFARYFSQLFGTFLLRIGTSTEGLSARALAYEFGAR